MFGSRNRSRPGQKEAKALSRWDRRDRCSARSPTAKIMRGDGRDSDGRAQEARAVFRNDYSRCSHGIRQNPQSRPSGRPVVTLAYAVKVLVQTVCLRGSCHYVAEGRILVDSGHAERRELSDDIAERHSEGQKIIILSAAIYVGSAAPRLDRSSCLPASNNSWRRSACN